MQIYRAGGGGGGGLRILDPVHTTPFSSENDAVLFRIRLPSTLYNAENDQWKRINSKTLSRVERFKNGTVWKRCFPSVDGENDALWKRWRHHNNNTTWLQTTQP